LPGNNRPVKVHCHLCGATLRRPEDFLRVTGRDPSREILVCSDFARCDRRISFDLFGEEVDAFEHAAVRRSQLSLAPTSDPSVR